MDMETKRRRTRRFFIAVGALCVLGVAFAVLVLRGGGGAADGADNKEG